MADELSYSSDDLYGQYGYEGNQNVTFSALDAIISNLKVSSAQIENAAITSAHIKEIDADTVTITNLKASNIKSLNGLNVGNGNFVIDANGNVTMKGTLNGATGTFSGTLATPVVEIDSGTSEYATINFHNQYVKNEQMTPRIQLWREQLTFAMNDDTATAQAKPFEYMAFITNDFRIIGNKYKNTASETKLSLLADAYSGMNAGIEILGALAYIDFKNSSGDDFDARLILNNDNALELKGSDFLANEGWIYTDTVVASNQVYSSNWFRSRGQSGWYSEDYGGGWYMTDSTWIRAYNNKKVYTPTSFRADGGYELMGQTPFYVWTGNIPASGTSGDVYINHNLGYKPIVTFDGNVGNIILTVSHISNNQVRIYSYPNNFSGTVRMY